LLNDHYSTIDHYCYHLAAPCLKENLCYLPVALALGLGQVLEFMYTAKLNLSCHNVEDVVAVASFLQMQEVVNACSAYQSVTAVAPASRMAEFATGEVSR